MARALLPASPAVGIDGRISVKRIKMRFMARCRWCTRKSTASITRRFVMRLEHSELKLLPSRWIYWRSIINQIRNLCPLSISLIFFFFFLGPLSDSGSK